MRVRSILIAVALALAAVSPAYAAGSGSAVGTVVVDGGPCITVEGGFDFGTGDFGDLDPIASLASVVTVTNCSETRTADVLVRGTDATGDGAPPAIWKLHQEGTYSCTSLQPNLYKVGVEAQAEPGITILSSNDTLTPSLFGLSAGGTSTYSGGLWMPCPGSDGAGQTMTFSIIFTAVLRDA